MNIWFPKRKKMRGCETDLGVKIWRAKCWGVWRSGEQSVEGTWSAWESEDESRIHEWSQPQWPSFYTVLRYSNSLLDLVIIYHKHYGITMYVSESYCLLRTWRRGIWCYDGNENKCRTRWKWMRPKEYRVSSIYKCLVGLRERKREQREMSKSDIPTVGKWDRAMLRGWLVTEVRTEFARPNVTKPLSMYVFHVPQQLYVPL